MEPTQTFDEIFAAARPFAGDAGASGLDLIGANDVIIVGAGRVNVFAQAGQSAEAVGGGQVQSGP